MHGTAVTAVAALLIAGCATDINRINASRYYEAGLAFEARKQDEQARSAYWPAVVYYRASASPHNPISAATFNLERLTGLTSKLPVRSQSLHEALRVQEEL